MDLIRYAHGQLAAERIPHLQQAMSFRLDREGVVRLYLPGVTEIIIVRPGEGIQITGFFDRVMRLPAETLAEEIEL
jgi:hypothetical protein